MSTPMQPVNHFPVNRNMAFGMPTANETMLEARALIQAHFSRPDSNDKIAIPEVIQVMDVTDTEALAFAMSELGIIHSHLTKRNRWRALDREQAEALNDHPLVRAQGVESLRASHGVAKRIFKEILKSTSAELLSPVISPEEDEEIGRPRFIGVDDQNRIAVAIESYKANRSAAGSAAVLAATKQSQPTLAKQNATPMGRQLAAHMLGVTSRRLIRLELLAGIPGQPKKITPGQFLELSRLRRGK